MEKVYPRPEQFKGVGDPSSERRVNVIFKREAFDVIDRLSQLTGRSRSRIVSDLVTDCLPALQKLLNLQAEANRHAKAANSALKEFLDNRLQDLEADVSAAGRPQSAPLAPRDPTTLGNDADPEEDKRYSGPSYDSMPVEELLFGFIEEDFT